MSNPHRSSALASIFVLALGLFGAGPLAVRSAILAQEAGATVTATDLAPLADFTVPNDAGLPNDRLLENLQVGVSDSEGNPPFPPECLPTPPETGSAEIGESGSAQS